MEFKIEIAGIQGSSRRLNFPTLPFTIAEDSENSLVMESWSAEWCCLSLCSKGPTEVNNWELSDVSPPTTTSSRKFKQSMRDAV